jgi:hypothetical protein
MPLFQIYDKVCIKQPIKEVAFSGWLSTDNWNHLVSFKLGIPANKVIFTLDKIDELKVLGHNLSVLVKIGNHRVSLPFFLLLIAILLLVPSFDHFLFWIF